MDMQHIGLPLVVIYAITTVGRQYRRGMDFVGAAARGLDRECCTQNRDADLRMCRVADRIRVACREFVGRGGDRRTRGGAHQGWSANLFTTASDLFPRRVVVGIGGMAGSIGGVLFSEVIGQVLQRTGHYWVLFAIGASAYLIAFVIMHMLTPKMAPAKLGA